MDNKKMLEQLSAVQLAAIKDSPKGQLPTFLQAQKSASLKSAQSAAQAMATNQRAAMQNAYKKALPGVKISSNKALISRANDLSQAFNKMNGK